MTVDLAEAPIERIGAFPHDPIAFGDAWLASRRSAVRSVPSAIVPDSRNLLLDPAHPDAERMRVAAIRPLAFDGPVVADGRQGVTRLRGGIMQCRLLPVTASPGYP